MTNVVIVLIIRGLKGVGKPNLGLGPVRVGQRNKLEALGILQQRGAHFDGITCGFARRRERRDAAGAQEKSQHETHLSEERGRDRTCASRGMDDRCSLKLQVRRTVAPVDERWGRRVREEQNKNHNP